MSVLGGFDVVVEFLPSALAPQLGQAVTLDGQAGLPFEIERQFDQGGAAGSALLIVRTMNVDLPKPQLEDQLLLSFGFTDASLSITAPASKTACGLDGTIEVAFPILLSNAGRTDAREYCIAADLSDPDVAVDFSDAADDKLEATFAGAVAVATLEAVMADRIAAMLRRLGIKQSGDTFLVDPGQEGDFATRRFCRLEVHTIYSYDPALRRVVLLGSMLRNRKDAADFASKDSVRLQAGEDAATSISAEEFSAYVKSQDLGLPSEVKEFDIRFDDGYLVAYGSAEYTGFCFTATAKFSAWIWIRVVDGKLVASAAFPPDGLDIEIVVPWYCYMATAAFGWIAPLILEGLRQAFNRIVDPVVVLLADFLLIGFDVDLPGGDAFGMDLMGVDVTREGLVLRGALPADVPAPREPSAELVGSVVTDDMTLIASDQFDSSLCPGLETIWMEFQQTQRGTYQVQTNLVSKPLGVAWYVYDGASLHELTGAQGEITLPMTTSYPPVPGHGGGAVVTQDVTIEYWIAGTRIVLVNDPVDGNYALTVHAAVSNCDGTVNLVVENVAYFQGDRVMMTAPSVQAWLECLTRPKVDVELPTLPHWPPIDHPPPERMIELVRQLTASGSAEGEQMLSVLPALYGRNYEEALHIARGDIGARPKVELEGRTKKKAPGSRVRPKLARPRVASLEAKRSQHALKRASTSRHGVCRTP
jgi:hypothetical protein